MQFGLHCKQLLTLQAASTVVTGCPLLCSKNKNSVNRYQNLMKIITVNIVKRTVVVLCFFAPLQLLSAEAINQADTNAQELNRQQERQRLLRQQQEIKPDVREAAERLKDSTNIVTV